MKNILFAFFLLFFSFQIFSQKYTISGFISDASSGEKLIQATVLDRNSGLGTTSNLYGFYSITLPKGTVELRFSYVGYKTIVKQIKLDTNIKLNIDLQDNATLKEFTVVASEAEKVQRQNPDEFCGFRHG